MRVLRRMSPTTAFAALCIIAVFSLASACGGAAAAPATPECYLAQEGQVVGAFGADCLPPEGVEVEPTPTFTPIPTGGGATDGRGLIITYGCATCHTLESVPQAQGKDGPELTGVGSMGADFIRQSIVDPSAVLTEGYPDGLMPQDFADQMTAEEIDTIVEFLASQ